MKAKNILMTLLLVAGAIAAKASGYPPELALVTQPVIVYNHSSITVYYDVENIGDYTYRGDVYIFLEPDFGYYYAKKYVKVYPGRIKRIAVDIPAYSFDLHRTFTIMPYYEVGRELYSFTTFEYFEPVCFYWHGPRTEPWVVIHVGPRPRYYHRPGSYRYYYDGYRPPMHAHGPGMPPPMDPMHHTYGYHYSIGGYPGTHPEWSNHNEMPKPSNDVAPAATVRPKEYAGSMSGASGTTGSLSGGSASTGNRAASTGSSSGSVSRPSSNGSASGSVSRPSSNSSTSRPSSSSNVSGSSTRPATNGTASRPSSSSSSSVSRPSGSTSRPSGNSSSSMSGSSSRTTSGSSARTSSSSRSSGTSARTSSSSRSSGTSARTSSSSSSTRSSGSSSTRSSSSSNSSRGGSSSGRR